jgi:hypothetical protein
MRANKREKTKIKRKKKLKNGKIKTKGAERSVLLPRRKAGRPPGPQRRLERLEGFMLLAMSELKDLKEATT